MTISLKSGPRFVGASLFGIAAFTMFGGLSHSFGASTSTSSIVGLVLSIAYFAVGLWCYKDAAGYADLFNYQTARATAPVKAGQFSCVSRREIVAGSILGMTREQAIAAIENAGFKPAEQSPYGPCTLEGNDNRIIFYVRDGLVFKSQAA